MDDKILQLLSIIGHEFKQVKLLELALTHSSYANERSQAGEHIESNERMEFLGDAVLDLCVSEELYRRFPGAPEGQLTKLRARLVSEASLAEVARELGLHKIIRLGRGEASQGGRERAALLCDATEAVLGAVFLDGGFAAACACVRRILADRWPAGAEVIRVKDPKSRLQELTQGRFKARPVYRLLRSEGPDHAKVFTVCVTLPDGTEIVSGGASLKKAEQMAATMALQSLGAQLDAAAFTTG